MRKFHPYAVEAVAKGRKVYHLNIGQPDVATPPVFFEAISNFTQPILAYASARRRDTVLEKLSKIPGVVYSQPDGAFYIMAALPVDDAEEFQKWLMTDFEDNGETVMFAPARSFYQTPGKGINEIRIAYVLKQQDLERAMDLLALGIEAYNNRKN